MQTNQSSVQSSAAVGSLSATGLVKRYAGKDVVQGVSLAGPHATMKIKVKNQVWDVTLAPPALRSRSGLKEGVIPVGDTVTIRGNRSTEPGHFEMKTIYVRHGKDEFHVYPDRE